MRWHKLAAWVWLPGGLLAAGLTLLWLLLGDLPDPADAAQARLQPTVRIVDRQGRTLYDVVDAATGRHRAVPLAAIPVALRQATIAVEDRDFYTHPGVDWRGILRAGWINLRGGEVLAGGSTITQQVARNVLLDADERAGRTIRRKLRESWLAWQLSRRLSKDEVLAIYLNQIYYGGLAYGVEAAALTYFGKSVADLTLAESALIAGLPQAPAAYNPLVNPAAARRRQETVLQLMQTAGFITSAQHELAAREPLRLAAEPYPVVAPHFVMMVQRELDALLPAEARTSRP